MIFINKPQCRISPILNALGSGKWQHWVGCGNGDGGGGGVDSYMIQLLTHPRSICAILCVPTLGAQVLHPVFFHWGFRLSWIKRKGNLFFKVEEIDFQSYSLSIPSTPLFSLRTWIWTPPQALLDQCLSPTITLPQWPPSGDHGSLPSRGYLAIFGHIVFVTTGEGCCYWHVIGRGHWCCYIHTLQCMGQLPTTKNIQNVSSAKIQLPCIKKSH